MRLYRNEFQQVLDRVLVEGLHSTAIMRAHREMRVPVSWICRLRILHATAFGNCAPRIAE